jgi:hypothetical protein
LRRSTRPIRNPRRISIFLPLDPTAVARRMRTEGAVSHASPYLRSRPWGWRSRESSRARAARRWHLADPAQSADGDTGLPADQPILVPPRRTTWLERAGIALAMLAAIAVVIWHLGAERRAIQSLPQAERQAAYARTFESFRSLCGTDRADSLREHCHEQAQLLLDFPECDSFCEFVISRELSARR